MLHLFAVIIVEQWFHGGEMSNIKGRVGNSYSSELVGLRGMITDVHWSFDQCSPLEWSCVSKSGEWKVLRLSGGSICYSAMLLNHVALTVRQKWVLVLSFCQSMYPTFLGRGEKVILFSLILLYLLMDHLKSITLHSTLRPVIGWLCFHLREEIKSDSRQMPSIISLGKIPVGWFPIISCIFGIKAWKLPQMPFFCNPSFNTWWRATVWLWMLKMHLTKISTPHQ